MTRYLFHNIYGDAAALIAAKPEDVIAVPSGWDAETEQTRQALLAELGASVSALPSLLYWVEARETDGEGEEGPVTIPARWQELRIADMAQPWTWEAIAERLAPAT